MPSHKVLMPARLSFDASGVPRAEAFDDVYHSADGGPAQARHVFLAGNDLPARWRGCASFTILEVGFGLGLNFLCVRAALKEDSARPTRLHYVAVEKHPLDRADLERVHRQWPELSDFARELDRQWPPLLAGFHRLHFDGGRVVLTLLFGDAAQMLAELDCRADAVFLDGFKPDANPAMWSSALFGELARLSGPGTTAATWTVAGAIRERLRQAGFEVEKRGGFGRKREMLAAVRPGRERPADGASFDARHAIVIGAGLAGSWCTHALAARGWRVELIERHRRPANEASGNAVGVVRPALNLADNENAQLSRAAFLFAANRLAIEPALERVARADGVLHVATSPARATRMARILEAHRFPCDYVRWVDAEEAARLAGHPVAGPGWWIPHGGWARPGPLCERLLDEVADRVIGHFGRDAASIERTGDGWRVIDARGMTIADAPVLVLANACDAARLPGAVGVPPLIPVRGQVSYLPAAPTRHLEIVVCGDGYVAPLPGGGHCVGATFEPDSTDLEVRQAGHAENLARAERMLPGICAGVAAAELQGRVALRTATADRLPACGGLADEGLHLVAGMGARGLIWAPLCAEVLASRIEREPNPIERSAIAAMAPARLMPKRAK